MSVLGVEANPLDVALPGMAAAGATGIPLAAYLKWGIPGILGKSDPNMVNNIRARLAKYSDAYRRKVLDGKYPGWTKPHLGVYPVGPKPEGGGDRLMSSEYNKGRNQWPQLVQGSNLTDAETTLKKMRQEISRKQRDLGKSKVQANADIKKLVTNVQKAQDKAYNAHGTKELERAEGALTRAKMDHQVGVLDIKRELKYEKDLLPKLTKSLEEATASNIAYDEFKKSEAFKKLKPHQKILAKINDFFQVPATMEAGYRPNRYQQSMPWLEKIKLPESISRAVDKLRDLKASADPGYALQRGLSNQPPPKTVAELLLGYNPQDAPRRGEISAVKGTHEGILAHEMGHSQQGRGWLAPMQVGKAVAGGGLGTALLSDNKDVGKWGGIIGSAGFMPTLLNELNASARGAKMQLGGLASFPHATGMGRFQDKNIFGKKPFFGHTMSQMGKSLKSFVGVPSYAAAAAAPYLAYKMKDWMGGYDS